MKKIGFIGIGIMGKSMVRNLMKAGYEVAVYSRTRSKAEDVISEGAVWCEDVKACSKGRDAVISIVGYPKDVEEVYFGENGIIANADKGTCLIDMTTTSPKLAVRIYEEAKQAGLKALDAPVTGGDTGAREGTLPYWLEERRILMTAAFLFLKQWERPSNMRERPETANIPKCAIRLPLQEPFRSLRGNGLCKGQWP